MSISAKIKIYDAKTHVQEINLPTGKKIKLRYEGGYYVNEGNSFIPLEDEEIKYIRDHFMNTEIIEDEPI